PHLDRSNCQESVGLLFLKYSACSRFFSRSRRHRFGRPAHARVQQHPSRGGSPSKKAIMTRQVGDLVALSAATYCRFSRRNSRTSCWNSAPSCFTLSSNSSRAYSNTSRSRVFDFATVFKASGSTFLLSGLFLFTSFGR